MPCCAGSSSWWRSPVLAKRHWIVFLVISVMDILVQGGRINYRLPRLREVKVALLGCLVWC